MTNDNIEITVAENREKINHMDKSLDKINNTLTDIYRKLSEIPIFFKSNFVTKEEFEPIKKMFYVVLSIVAVTITAAALKIIFAHG